MQGRQKEVSLHFLHHQHGFPCHSSQWPSILYMINKNSCTSFHWLNITSFQLNTTSFLPDFFGRNPTFLHLDFVTAEITCPFCFHFKPFWWLPFPSQMEATSLFSAFLCTTYHLSKTIMVLTSNLSWPTVSDFIVCLSRCPLMLESFPQIFTNQIHCHTHTPPERKKSPIVVHRWTQAFVLLSHCIYPHFFHHI